MKSIQIIGDVHQKYEAYRHITDRCDYSLQLGDMGFYYELDVDPERHKFFGGNHDNYDIYHMSEYSIGDYGEYSLNGVPLFFIRGAYSIDVKRRLAASRKEWWDEEQLSRREMDAAMNEYSKSKPKVMITHACPNSISKMVGKPDVLRHFGHNPKTFTTPTQQMLEECFNIHKPDVWIFGHFHEWFDTTVDGTLFVCIPELEEITLNEDGSIEK
jgi:predicted phosphodiesterase